MQLEICGTGFLGSFAWNHYNPAFGYTVSRSSKNFQYCLDEFRPKSKRQDILLNLSGPSSVEDSMARSLYYQSAPLEQVKCHIKLLSQLEHSPHYVFVSSAAVYGDCQFPYPDENSSLKPLSPYAHGKALAEEYLLSVGPEYAGGITIVRATSIFAESLNERIFGRIRSSLAKKEDFELFGDGTETRDFLHASDFFKLIDSAIQNSLSFKGAHVYNIGSGNPISTRTLLELAMKVKADQSHGLSVTFNGEIRVGDPHTIAVSTRKIGELVGNRVPDPISRIEDYFLSKPEDPERQNRFT